MMVNFYAPYQKKKIKKILSSYPAIGLIGIAVSLSLMILFISISIYPFNRCLMDYYC